jgi:hypothetical protein
VKDLVVSRIEQRIAAWMFLLEGDDGIFRLFASV